jgi:hypothetical protein
MKHSFSMLKSTPPISSLSITMSFVMCAVIFIQQLRGRTIHSWLRRTDMHGGEEKERTGRETFSYDMLVVIPPRKESSILSEPFRLLLMSSRT